MFRTNVLNIVKTNVKAIAPSTPAVLFYLDLLGALRHVVLPLARLLHESGVAALLHLLLVLQRRHLLGLVLHLPAATPHATHTH